MIMEFRGKYPKIDPTAFIAENAMVIGDVEIGPGSNIWFYSILRGDLYSIRIVKSLWSRACPLDIKFLIR
jgi:carbonic anhydrase/acetyltransferase-like protein (isoleucine patch superfamily)